MTALRSSSRRIRLFQAVSIALLTALAIRSIFVHHPGSSHADSSVEPSSLSLQSSPESSVSPYSYRDDTVRNATVLQQVANDVQRLPNCRGKERFLEILHTATQRIRVRGDICDKLPLPEDVEALYGPDPVVYGMETCSQFRATVQKLQQLSGNNSSTIMAPTVRVAGLYNTGTNALVQSLHRNLQQEHGVWNVHVQAKADKKQNWWELYNVPWSKHMPLRYRWNYTTAADVELDQRLVLPVVLIRDPYWWMKSMVRLQKKQTRSKETKTHGIRQLHSVQSAV